MNYYHNFELRTERNCDELCNAIRNISLPLYQKEIQRPSIQEIMDDFAMNGRICDDEELSYGDKNKMNKKVKFNRYKKFKNNKITHCVFCENNKEAEAVVRSHSVRDKEGRVLCPKLRIYVCPICGESGDTAHTVKYCPKKRIITLEETYNMELLKTKFHNRAIEI